MSPLPRILAAVLLICGAAGLSTHSARSPNGAAQAQGPSEPSAQPPAAPVLPAGAAVAANDSPASRLGASLTAQAAALDGAAVKSLQVRFIHTRTDAGGRQIRLQMLARCQGPRWLDSFEEPLPEADLKELLAGRSIANAGKAGKARRIEWGDDKCTYRAMAGTWSGGGIRPAKRPAGLPAEGQAYTLLAQVGYFRQAPSVAGRRVEAAKEADTFTIYHDDERLYTVCRMGAGLADRGLPESLSLYANRVLLQQEKYEHWGQYGGVWLPLRYTRTLHYDPAKAEADPLRQPAAAEPQAIDRWELLDVAANTPLKPEDLALQIPEGTRILDDRFGIRIRYDYKSDRTEADLLAMALKANEDQQVNGPEKR